MDAEPRLLRRVLPVVYPVAALVLVVVIWAVIVDVYEVP